MSEEGMISCSVTILGKIILLAGIILISLYLLLIQKSKFSFTQQPFTQKFHAISEFGSDKESDEK